MTEQEATWEGEGGAVVVEESNVDPVETGFTAAQLIAELRAKYYSNPLGTSTIGVDNVEDSGRLQIQVDANVISPIILARYLNVKPQMVYQAIREGKLTAVSWNNTQKKFIRLPEAMRWAAKYLTRKQLRDLQTAAEEQAGRTS